jgi:8-hydroxy-5-deazaflavin:NADPH oxidoreductase
MKVGIIGSGNMGRALGIRLAQEGHQVSFGSRRPDQAQSAAAQAGRNGSSGSNDEAARVGEVLFWTMRETEPGSVLGKPSLLDGKIVVDINNRDYGQEAKTGAWFATSIAERLQDNTPGAQVVKAFNTIAMETFDTAPDALRASGAQTFIAGNDATAKQMVAALAKDLGLQAVDLGEGPAAFRAAEALGDVIRLLMIDGGHGGRAHLVLTRLPEPGLGAIGGRAKSDYG